MKVAEWHDKISEEESHAQKFIGADRQSEAFAQATWEADGGKHTILGDFMSTVVRVTRGLFWDGPRTTNYNIQRNCGHVSTTSIVCTRCGAQVCPKCCDRWIVSEKEDVQCPDCKWGI